VPPRNGASAWRLINFASIDRTEGGTTLATELDNIYVPRDERTLRRTQREVERIDRRARQWARVVVDLLPRGLLMLEDETELLCLFLAQQRRLNMQIDANQPREETPLTVLSRILPFMTTPEDEMETALGAHRIVAARLESDIDRAFQAFCEERTIDLMSEAAIDWRVAIRYLAQEVHRLASQVNLGRDYYNSPHRFEIALRTRDLTADIIGRREVMLATVPAKPPAPKADRRRARQPIAN
jgi:hypothetical protein